MARTRRSALHALLGTLAGTALLGPSADDLTAATTKKTNDRGRDSGKDSFSRQHNKQQRRQLQPIPGHGESWRRTRPCLRAGQLRDGAVTAASAVCIPAGEACTQGVECCTGRCLGNGTCSCNASNQCPQPTEPCQKAICNDKKRCVIKNRNGTSCQRDQGPGVCKDGVCADCVTASDCTAPRNGTVACSQGRCVKHCTNNFHRICGSGAGVCQECCEDKPSHCNSIEGTTCINGRCKCSGGLTRCGTVGQSPSPECVDLSREPYHCGSCGNVCPSGRCVNGKCKPPETCGTHCTKQGCVEIECRGDQECVNSNCACPDGTVDCDGDGFCESCGRCGVTTCPTDPVTDQPGFCCAGGYCSCGGTCCAGPGCWVVSEGHNGDSGIFGERETCTGCAHVDCWGACCTNCIDGQCVTSGPIGGGSIRRR